jgi:hypothetical protein
LAGLPQPVFVHGSSALTGKIPVQCFEVFSSTGRRDFVVRTSVVLFFDC